MAWPRSHHPLSLSRSPLPWEWKLSVYSPHNSVFVVIVVVVTAVVGDIYCRRSCCCGRCSCWRYIVVVIIILLLVLSLSLSLFLKILLAEKKISIWDVLVIIIPSAPTKKFPMRFIRIPNRAKRADLIAAELVIYSPEFLRCPICCSRIQSDEIYIIEGNDRIVFD